MYLKRNLSDLQKNHLTTITHHLKKSLITQLFHADLEVLKWSSLERFKYCQHKNLSFTTEQQTFDSNCLCMIPETLSKNRYLTFELSFNIKKINILFTRTLLHSMWRWHVALRPNSEEVKLLMGWTKVHLSAAVQQDITSVTI